MSLFRYDPPAGSPPIEGHTRAAAGPVVCRACGCRLELSTASLERDGETTAGMYRHFEGLPGRDARGCRVACVDLTHGRDGRVQS